MKINGFNSLTSGHTLPVEALNLRDGQKIVAKVISASVDEALLEMAGHSFQAKIEGNPEVTPGAVLKLLVNHDQQGRVLLKIISQDQPTSNPGNLDASAKPTLDPNLQKAITTALTKEGLPVNRENIENFTRLLQSFENKYQQSLPPQVLAFITSHKWPVNQETIITAWLYQDAELRDLMWNWLRQSESGRTGANIFARLMLGISAQPEELQAKLGTLIKQIETILRYVNRSENGIPNPAAGQNQAGANGLFSQSLFTDHPELNRLLRQALPKPAPEGVFGQTSPLNKEQLGKGASQLSPGRAMEGSDLKTPLINELKQLLSKVNTTFEQKDLSEKIEAILDRNLALNKAELQENSANGNYNLIPLLVNDSQNFLHEVLIKWREESDGRKAGQSEQVLQMNIPTDNMGEINLALRTGGNGTRITFKVGTDSVRKYLLRNLAELKENIKSKEIAINVALETKENLLSPAYDGVDLWI